MTMTRLRHIVLFRFYDAIDEDSRMHAVDQISALRDQPGILEWTLKASIDDRKGAVIVQNVLFESEDAFNSYREHAKHKAVGEALSGMADWLVADYLDQH